MSALPSSTPHATPAAGELVPLSPAQQRTLDTLVTVAQVSPVTVLQGETGTGKTTILRYLQQRLGAHFINLSDIFEALKNVDPQALDETVYGVLTDALAQSDLIIFDDLTNLEQVTRYHMAYARPYLFEGQLKAVFDLAHANGKRIVFSRQKAKEGFSYGATKSQATRVVLERLTAEDYRAILGNHLGAAAVADLDAVKLAREFTRLNGYQLKTAAALLKQQGHASVTTEQVADILVTYLVSGNLNTAEVEAVTFDQLKGAEHMIEALERTVLLPLQDVKRAQLLGLKPKRGVLLHGAPGTGKTTIGRALAHSMKGKFFMIDGTVSSEPPGKFFDDVDRIFEAAQTNSPSVIFIDDADVLFKTDHVYGFNRYLLTKLDGLASETVGNVCVIMTAMDIRDMPPPLLRSGRVEVWLETRLPDLDNRKLILRHYAKNLPDEFRAFDEERLAHISEGFTPADLRRVVGDAKGLLAYDQHKERPVQSFSDYLVKASLELRELKNAFAKTWNGPQLPATDHDTVRHAIA